ncbi:hypothetical protein BJ912DRAFT_277 [Pholiota molesta]|nr:hypothetical protein BJ912DRAFT_277 [Pholiota molesta]
MLKAARKLAKKRAREQEFDDIPEDAAISDLSTEAFATSIQPTDNVSTSSETQQKRQRLEAPDSDVAGNLPIEVPDEQVLKRVYTRPQGASTFMDGFRPKFAAILQAMLSMDYHSTTNELCRCGRPGASRECHCHDCAFFEPCCRSCFIESHVHMPHHWVELWNGAFFERKDISEIGHVITYGHDTRGGSCPHARVKPLDFTIIDLNGVHRTKIQFCACIGNNRERFDHLIQSFVFPATVSQPQIGFTFNLLKDFHLQTLTSKKSPYDYLFAIRQKTSNAFVDGVPNPYPQFLRVQRIWRVLTVTLNSGQAHNIDTFFPLRRPGSVMVPCFACPEPGFNVPDDQWAMIDDNLQFLHTLFIMTDGHFGLQRLMTSKEDPDDISLLEGGGLFPPDEEYNTYVRETVAYSTEKTTCSRFNAVEMQNVIKFRFAIITAVLAVECMRHSIFLSMVDLQKGERYANADFALAYALRRFTFLQSMSRAKYFSRILETYDVACQYYVHLKARFQKNFPDLADTVDLIHLLVPKKHLDGHKDDCKYRFSLNYTDGTGRSHGEGIEASWAESKQSGGSTRQMNHGHRHDTLNDFHNYWNWNKIRGLGQSLFDALQVACAKRTSMIDYFLGLSLLRGQENVERWEAESTKPWFIDGEWQSVYRLKQSKLPSQASILQSLEATEKAQDAESEERSGRHGSLSHLVHVGIKLQEKQRELRHLISYPEGSDPAAIISRRQSLALEITSWRKSQLKALPQLDHFITSTDPNTNAEDDILFLPSDIPFEQHETLGITPVAFIERELREGQANDAISSLCNSILHTMVLRDAKKEHAHGVYQNTRAGKFINSVKAKKRLWMARYNEARSRLLSLTNNDPKIMDNFPVLKEEDTYAKNATSARNLGDGVKVDSWIWTFGRLKGLSRDERDNFAFESSMVSCSCRHDALGRGGRAA